MFTVTVKPEGVGPPPAVRLRRWLKSALRGYGLRCVKVVTAMETQACRSCHAPIFFAKTLKGKWLPLDTRPAEDGTILLKMGVAVFVSKEDRERRILEARAASQPPPVFYKSHFATCPNAKTHRKRGDDGKGKAEAKTPGKAGGPLRDQGRRGA